MKPRRLALLALAGIAGLAFAAPSVFPTGVTLYQPQQTWNGYTVLSWLHEPAVVVIDMNGHVVKRWEDFNLSSGGPARVLPGGEIIAPVGARPGHQESLHLVQQDFAGKELWRLEGEEEIAQPDGTQLRSLRQHHDWQRADFPGGYYSPASKPASTGAATLVVTHTARSRPAVSDLPLEDDHLVEYDAAGHKRWEWFASDHIDELGFSPAARAAIKAGAGAGTGPAQRSDFDWLHMNSAAWLGPNRWFDAGDTRFAPDNVLISSRQASLLAIVARNGRIVWRIGPDFRDSPALMRIGQLVGQHNAHLIPKGLPGAGNLLVFDNGGSSGYGVASPMAQNGYGGLARNTSRVLEIDPVKLELVWSYTNPNFFSTNISSAQRLPNGNTLITEGAPGRIFEVTPQKRIVWEYMNPAAADGSNSVYRAYRVPYDWIPQLTKPAEIAVVPPASMMAPRDPP